MEAYASVYDQPEQIDEGITSVVNSPQDKTKGPGPTYKGSRIKMGPGEGGRFPKKKEPKGGPGIVGAFEKLKKNLTKEDADPFDIVKGHLIDEHNLSEDVAIQVMTLLDEETRGEIMEYTAAIRADAAPKGTTAAIRADAAPKGTTVKMTADGKEPVGDRLLRGIKDRVGGFLRNLNPNALKSTTVEPRKPLIAIPKN